jgi:UDP-N-acetylenolpyruvoylglucosamine reductase
MGFSLPAKTPFLLVELRGLEPLTPTLPGAGGAREQAAGAAGRAVVGVVERATVVSVVVKIVVNALPDHICSDGDFDPCQGFEPRTR